MKKLKIFLASSNELENERRKFEIEIYRKTKYLFDKGYFLHLDIWEDLSAKMSATGSQSEYNKFVESSDIFILLAHTKVGMYTAEEFENALGQFNASEKPFIYTYFKNTDAPTQESLPSFKEKLSNLGHFYSNFDDFNDLWVQFNKELDRLELNNFSEHKQSEEQTAKITYQQNAEKIYNIDKIEGGANFS